MTDVPFLPPGRLRQLLRAHGLSPRRRWGQHFLVDRSALERMLDIVGLGPGDRVMEVGAGAGTLTAALASRASRVVAVELDRGLLPVLEEVLAGYGASVDLIMADALKLDWEELLGDRGWVFASNLPYNITTPVLERVLQSGLFTRAVVMVQRDVARRLAARPGTADYSSLTVFAAYHGQVRLELVLGPSSFYPRPAVDSAVISIDLAGGPRVEVSDPALMLDLVRYCFRYRRKQLVNSLAGCPRLAAMGLDRDGLRAALDGLGWAEVRGEVLSPTDFGALTEALVRKART